jgi:hypothetical protein
MKENNNEQYDELTASCPLCKEKGQVTKQFESWELYEHLKSKEHTKSSLASFFAYDEVFEGHLREYD